MTAPPVLFVTGLGRCGTTMVMHMLRAAGVPCAGSPPSFEDIPVSPSRVDHDWVASQFGKAVKWIDPTHTHVRHKNGAAILLVRDPVEQAKSQIKLLGVSAGRLQRRAMAQGIIADTRRARRIVENLFGAHFVLTLSFEKVLANPLGGATQLARFCDTLGLPFGLEKDAADIVINRSPACAPDLFVEMYHYG